MIATHEWLVIYMIATCEWFVFIGLQHVRGQCLVLESNSLKGIMKVAPVLKCLPQNWVMKQTMTFEIVIVFLGQWPCCNYPMCLVINRCLWVLYVRLFLIAMLQILALYTSQKNFITQPKSYHWSLNFWTFILYAKTGCCLIQVNQHRASIEYLSFDIQG